jgi:hypothetical protein
VDVHPQENFFVGAAFAKSALWDILRMLKRVQHDGRGYGIYIRHRIFFFNNLSKLFLKKVTLNITLRRISETGASHKTQLI